MLDLSTKSITWMILSVVIFIALNPGVLLTIPSMDGTFASMWTPNGPTSQVVVHAVVSALLLNLAGGLLKRMGLLVEKYKDPRRRR